MAGSFFSAIEVDRHFLANKYGDPSFFPANEFFCRRWFELGNTFLSVK